MNIDCRELWNERKPVLTIRDPSWVLKTSWAIPVALVLPMMWERVSNAWLLAWLVISAVYLAYAAVTYIAWRRTDTRERNKTTIILIMGLDGLNLALISMSFGISVINGLGFMEIDAADELAWIGSMLYVGITAFIVLNAGKILSHLSDREKQGIASQSKAALAIPTALVSAAVAFGAVMDASSAGLFIALGLMALGSFLTLPFAVLALFQVVYLAPDLIGE